MNADTVKAIQDALTPLATKIGEGAAHVYQIYVKQQYVTGIGEIISCAVLLLIVLALTILFVRWADATEPDIYSLVESKVTRKVLVVMAGAFACFILTFILVDGVQHLINPEYYAIQDILLTAKGSK